MKKVISAPERVVEEMLRGMELAHSGLLRLTPEHGALVRADAPMQNTLALVSGGSGQEPTHGGYVGPGLLDASDAHAHDVLKREGVNVYWMPYVGEYMTFEEEMKEYFEAPCDVAAGRPF